MRWGGRLSVNIFLLFLAFYKPTIDSMMEILGAGPRFIAFFHIPRPPLPPAARSDTDSNCASGNYRLTATVYVYDANGVGEHITVEAAAKH